MAELKDRLRADLTRSMKARDELRTATIRMALTGITNEEVAGRTARSLDDAEELRVITREAKKRREAAEAYDAAGRPELAARERAEGEVLDEYLPKQLDDAELSAMVGAAIEESGAASMREMGAVMKLLTSRVAGRADGARLSAAVRRQLAG